MIRNFRELSNNTKYSKYSVYVSRVGGGNTLGACANVAGNNHRGPVNCYQTIFLIKVAASCQATIWQVYGL